VKATSEDCALNWLLKLSWKQGGNFQRLSGQEDHEEPKLFSNSELPNNKGLSTENSGPPEDRAGPEPKGGHIWTFPKAITAVAEWDNRAPEQVDSGRPGKELHSHWSGPWAYILFYLGLERSRPVLLKGWYNLIYKLQNIFLPIDWELHTVVPIGGMATSQQATEDGVWPMWSQWRWQKGKMQKHKFSHHLK
jgi:hypothetical protein